VNVLQRRASSLFATSLILCLVGLCLVVALINGARQLTVLCLLVFGIMAGLKLWTKWSASNLGYWFDVDRERVFPGESVCLTLALENGTWLPLSYEGDIPFGRGLADPSGNKSLQAENTLLWFQSLRHEWELVARRRGVHAIGPATVATGDLLGFFVKERSQRERIEVVVYPRLVPLRHFSLPRRDFFGTPGGESPVDDPVYILGTVDYHSGRPARHIHWKASARHNRLQQKVFEPTEQEKVLLVVDAEGFSEEHDEAAFEETLEVVASLAAGLDRRGCALGLLTNGVVVKGTLTVPVTRNPFQIGAILEMLARMQRQQVMPMSHLLRKSPVVPWGTTCIYFALEATGETDRVRAFFSRQRAPLVFLAYTDISGLKEADRAGPAEGHPMDTTIGGAIAR
jgi:uncharacterized protein (DUF58 family)